MVSVAARLPPTATSATIDAPLLGVAVTVYCAMAHPVLGCTTWMMAEVFDVGWKLARAGVKSGRVGMLNVTSSRGHSSTPAKGTTVASQAAPGGRLGNCNEVTGKEAGMGADRVVSLHVEFEQVSTNSTVVASAGRASRKMAIEPEGLTISTAVVP